MMRTANPALNDKIFQGVRAHSGEVMTLEGTVNKTLIAVVLTAMSAYFTYDNPALVSLALPAVILGFVIALIITFKKTLAPYLTPVYAIVEGVFLGAISLFANTQYPGIVFQAVSLTFLSLFALLFAYKSGYIKATENFKLGVVAATGGIFLVYLVTFVLSLFGVHVGFMHGGGLLSIGISVFVCIIASLNLVLDFDFIENAAASKSTPKYMEWFGAFGLLITLVWLYIEVLRLLMKLQQRN